MTIKFCGAAKVITGTNYFINTGKTKFLVDCGLFQGPQELEAKNFESFPYEPKELSFVLITHSHLDHIGRLPRLTKEGFSGKIFATLPTIDFTHLMLEDSQKIAREKAIRAGIIPLTHEKEIHTLMGLFQTVKYRQKIKYNDEISFSFYEAGHILGSAIIELQIKDKTVVFSGDLGNWPVPILPKPKCLQDADYIIVESTYGDRNHENKGKIKDLIEDIAEEVISKNGVLIIPSFALERAQELLYQFNELVENHRIPQVPIFIDSPLTLKITEVYKKYENYFNKEATTLIKSGDDLFKFPGLKFTQSVEESKQINNLPPPKIIIAGSGMSQGGRILHHEALYLSAPENILLIVSYQAEGTLGRQLQDGAKEVKILDKAIPVRAKIERLTGYSAHADQSQLMEWLSCFKKPIKKIFVCQGERKPTQALAQKIKDEMGVEAEVPSLGDTVELT